MSAPGLALRGARFSAALASAAFALSALLAGPAMASASPPERTAAEESLSASLTADNTGVLSPGQDLAVSVTVTNTSHHSLPAGTVSVWLESEPQSSRNSLTAWLDSRQDRTRGTAIGRESFGQLDPGSSSVVRVTMPAAAVPFGTRPTSAVYGLGATVETGPSRVEARSSLAWSPGNAGARTGVSVVLPLVSPATGGGLISSDELATYTGPNGVLTRDLDGLTGNSAVTVGIDPMIIGSIRALGNAAPPSALDWLNRLSALPNDTFSLGYGDADLTGQLQAGLSAPLAPTTLSYALDPKNFTPPPTSIGEPGSETPSPATASPTPSSPAAVEIPTTEELLAWDYTLDGIAWPGDKTVRRDDLPLLASAGLATTIVSGDNTNSDDIEIAPNAIGRDEGNTFAVADSRLSEAFRQAVSAPTDLDWNTAMARLTAQLELLSTEREPTKRNSAEADIPRQMLIALDRSWPSSGAQLKRTLDTLFASTRTTPTTFADLLQTTPSSDLTLIDAPQPDTRITSIRTLLADEKALGDFSTVLDDPADLTGQARAQLLTLLAVSWQSPRTDWAAAIDKSRAAASKTLGSIRILPTENVNLVSAQGSIPFTVSNELPGESATVVLNAAPSNGRLEIDQPTTKTIPQDSQATVLVPVKAEVGNGQVVLNLQLHSPTGVPIGVPTAVPVEVHADWEGIGALVLGILLVLLFGFGIVRNIVRRLRERSAETAEGGLAEAEGTASESAESEGDAAGVKPGDG